MSTELAQYLKDIQDNLRLNRSEEREVINELETHIEDSLEALTESGISEEEATKTCMRLLGSARLVARQLYEAHSQGNWRQTVLASMPHLLFGFSFALNWWQHIGWLSVLLALVFGTVIYGSWRGKPAWVFSWLGYSLLPVLAFGILLMNLPRVWSVLAALFYLPLALWWLYYIVSRATKRDWLFVSLMLMPLPIIAGWFLVVLPEGIFNEYSLQRIYYFAPAIGLSFLALAFSMATFIRLRQRRLRITSLIIAGLLNLGIIAYSAHGGLTLHAFLILIVVMWGLFLIPPLLERRLRSGNTDSTN